MVKNREAWHAAVYGIAKSGTRLSNWTTTTTKMWKLHKIHFQTSNGSLDSLKCPRAVWTGFPFCTLDKWNKKVVTFAALSMFPHQYWFIKATILSVYQQFKAQIVMRSWIFRVCNRIRRRQWHPSPVLFPGKSHGWRSLVGHCWWPLKIGHNWVTSLSLFTLMHWRRKWQPTPVFLPGESHGWGSLVGSCLWGRTESDMTEAT